MFEKNPYQRIVEPNTQGRDFVVGDLHGCRSLLDAELEQVSFDTTKDRLFCTGDLVDRGPESEGCLELLAEPWFHAVLGNHDAMLVAWMLGRVEKDRERTAMYAYAFTHNRGWEWAKRFTRGSEFLPLLETLPFVIKMPGKWELVHAERVDAVTPMLITEDCPPHFIVGFGSDGTWQDHLLWGRSLAQSRRLTSMKSELRALLPVEQVYCGHTIVPKPTRFAGHNFLDTGAYKTGRLTVLAL